MADTELQQLIIYVGTTAKIDEAISAGIITENDLAISTDAPDYQEKLNQAQMDAVNSGITTQLVTLYDNHVANTTIHVTAQDKQTWNAKQNALNSTQMEAVNSGITSGGVSQITTNKNNIASEVTNRQNADNDLQSQIDAITASSDVTDIVGTYAQLQAYDTSSLPPNSIIKVLQDESQNNETTYYRWVINGGVGSWVLIGEEGPYYTKSEADSRFATAAQGAKADTALQPSALNGYATETWVGQQGFLTSTALVGYATEQWVQNQGYLTSSSLSNYVTTNTNQTITGQKTFLRTESQFQDSIARFVSTYNSSNAGWRGRVIIGAKDYTFLIGTYNGMAAIGGHKFSDSATESNADWSDIYFQPDGNKSIYMGGWDWTGGSGWFRVQNSGGNTGGKAQVNQGTIKNTDWKDVAYKGENISDFNNDAGYGTGTVKSVNSTSPDSNGNVSLNVGTFYWGE